ncbi:MAG TPA: co-chaperone GroES [Symbiobacteriaceae bacterium]|jgi:chaperonin GroES
MVTVASTNIRPLADRVLIRPQQQEERTKGGIVLPDTAKEKPQVGKVLAAGRGRVSDDGKRIPLDLTEGNLVLYTRYAGTEVKVDGEDLLLIGERDILAIVEG